MKTHEVEQGEDMAKIAERYGWPSWRALYEHECNAALRAARPDPFTLKRGDLVHIPDREHLKRRCMTGKVHVFGHKAPPPLTAILHLRFDMSEPRRYASKRYTLDVAGQRLEGFTGTDAQLHHAVPLAAEQATLELWLDGDEAEPERWQVDLSHLDPDDTISGLKGRMLNLGYLDAEGELDDALDDDARAAMQAFQASRALPITEAEDPDTAAALEARVRPEFVAGEEYLEVGRSHRLQLVAKLRHVCLRLATAGGVGYAQRRYELELDGAVIEGETSEDAELELDVPVTATRAELRIFFDDDPDAGDEPEIWELDLGEQPHEVELSDEDRFKAGLVNLGYLSASEAEDGAKLRDATAVFQAIHGLPPTGELDERTLARLDRA